MTDDSWQKLVEQNMNLVPYTIHKYFSWAIGEDRKEFTSIGYESLCKAAKTFDPNKGQFSTFAVTSIRGSIRKHLITYNTVHYPSTIHRVLSMLRRGCDVEEIADATNMSVYAIRQIQLSQHVVALDAPLGDGLTDSVGDLVSDPHNQITERENRTAVLQAIDRCIAEFSDKHRQIVQIYCKSAMVDGSPIAISQLSQQFNVSRQTIYTILHKFRKKLAYQLKDTELI